MLHLGTVALSVVMAFTIGVAPASMQGAEKEEPIYYEDTGGVYGDNSPTSYNTIVDITYASKTLTATGSLAYRRPTFSFSPAVGSCGAIAGGNVIGFYDRFDENLIPNHVSGTPILNAFAYNIGDQYTDALITQLYEYMAGGGVGMTEDQFKAGFTRFCTEKGKSVTFTSCMSSGSFSYSKLQTSMKANQPIVLFLSGYNIMHISTGEGSDSLAYFVSTATHIMVGFGYKSYSYATPSGTQNYDLISVSSGLVGSGNLDFFDIHYQTHIDDALAVNIY